jgi:tape measure domain-containing protein
VTGPIDTAVVEIVPDFSRFEGQTETGISAAMKGAETTVDTVVRAMEAQFTELAAQIGESFDAIQISTENSMHDISADAAANSDAIALQFDEMAAKVDAAFEEMQLSANHDLSQIEAKAVSTASATGGAFTKIAGLAKMGALGIGTGLAGVTLFGLKTAASLEQTQVAFNALNGSVAAGTKQFKDLQAFAAATPFEFTDLTVSAEKFDAMSAAIGKTHDQLIPYLTTIGNLVAETGGGAQALDSISLALGQTAGQGKLTLGNLEQINNAIPGFSAVAAIAAERGETTAQVMQEISSGSIDAKTGINQLLAGMAKFPGAAGAMAKQSETLLGVFSTFKDTVGQALSNAFAPAIPAIKASLTQITPIIGDTVKQMAPALGAIVSGLLPLLAKALQGLSAILTPILNALAPALKPIGDAFLTIGQALGPIVSALAPLLVMFANLANTVLKPLLPVIVQVGQVLGAVLVPIMTVIGQVFAQVGPVIAQVVTIMAATFMPAVKMLAPLVLKLFDALTPLLPSLLQLAPPIIQIVVAMAPLTTLMAQLLAIAIKIITPLIKLGTAIASWGIVQIVAPALSLIAWALGEILKPIAAVVGWIGGFVTWLSKLDWGKVAGEIGGLFLKAWDALASFFQKLPGRILSFISNLPSMLGNAAMAAMKAFFFAIGFGIGLIIDIFTKLPGRVWSLVTHMWHLLTTAFSIGIDKIVAFVRGMPNRIIHFFETLWDRAKAAFKKGVDSIVDFVQKLPGRVWDWLQKLPGKIWDAVKDAGKWLWNAGVNIIMGMIHGIESAVSNAIKAVEDAISSVIDGAEAALGIGSPSKVFMEIGKNTVAGYTLGITHEMPTATKTVQDLITPGSQSTSSSGAGNGVVFGAGAIVVQFIGGAPTEDQAFATGRAVGHGITDALVKRDVRNQVRTM